MAKISLGLISECDRISPFGLLGLGCKAIPWKHPWLPRSPWAIHLGKAGSSQSLTKC